MNTRDNKNIQKNDEQAQLFERKKPEALKPKSGELETLASVHRALQNGQHIAAPAEDTLRAAGTLGNQNVLKLIETGESRAAELEQARANTEAYNLAAALIGPPTTPNSNIVYPGISEG